MGKFNGKRSPMNTNNVDDLACHYFGGNSLPESLLWRDSNPQPLR
ncbi:hypothetical protein HanRHA438_Chr13g0591371 [Helianthus annuus]|nr:hypothetical protein HanRHA438_Chr13g0591371 [Helianthus annuus]